VSDVAQDAVLRMLAVDPTPRFETAQALRAYLWTAAWRLLLEQLRRPERQRRVANPSETSGLERLLATTGGLGRVEEVDRAAALRLAVGLLEPDEQAILDTVYFRAQGIEGAARELGISHDAAKMRVARARRSLARKLVKWIDVIG
jgi:RNA polymerase sigma factor (sigma-70 family)